jgi:hypothetical protein
MYERRRFAPPREGVITLAPRERKSIMRKFCQNSFRAMQLSAVTVLATLLIWNTSSRGQSFPGGFIEKAGSHAVRPRLTASQIQSFVPPRRGKFKFPSPYNTEGIRITMPEDCGGKDCVTYVGYSYWMNMNNHVGSDTMLIFLSLNRSLGGTGPTLFTYNKVTDEVKNLGPIFDPTSSFSWYPGADWYFSATQPTKLYVNDSGPTFYRYDVVVKKFEIVFDVRARFGSDKGVTQNHSSADDRVHSGTLLCKKAGCSDGTHVATKENEMMGCLVYHQSSNSFSYFPRKGKYDECNLDRGGRWLLIIDGDPVDGLGNRIIDLQNNTETVLPGQTAGRLGHLDMGDGYAVGANGHHRLPNTTAVIKFPPANTKWPGTVVHYNSDWDTAVANHVSHQNRRAGVPAEEQYACGSNLDHGRRENEIVCFRLDTSHNTLVVAPVMTNPDAPGPCDDYCKAPKGNLDVTGRYFIWTSNLGGSRMDAFIVKVPAQLLYSQDRSAANKAAR